MKTKTFLFFLILLVSNVNAQWEYLSNPYGNASVNTLTNVNSNLIAGVLGNMVDGGLYLSTDKGVTWQNKLGYNRVYSAEFDGNMIFVGTANGLYVSDDFGLNWHQNSRLQNIFAIASYDKKLLVGNSGVWISSDGGSTWYNDGSALRKYTIQTIVVFDNVLFAASPNNIDDDSYVFRSTNLGNSWELKKTGLPKTRIMSLAINKSKLFAATSDSGVYFSSDQGNSWISRNIGLSNLRAQKIFFVKDNLLVSTWGGLYISNNFGESWNSFNDGLENIVANSFTIDDSNIYVGTNFGGVYKRKISEIITHIKSVLPTTYKLEQNYPNPFNPETTIEYQLPTPGLVTLTVYDLLGREVATLVNEFKNAGSYNYQFSILNYQLASGVYFYRLQSGSYSETKKLVLVK